MMDRDVIKKLSPFLLLFVMLAFAFGAYLMQKANQNLNVSQISNQSTPKVVHLTGDNQNLTALQRKIPPGFYDVTVQSGEIETFPVQGVTKQYPGINILINKQDVIRLTQGAKVTLTASQQGKVSQTTFGNSAFYKVGTQIDSGTYQLSYGGKWVDFSPSAIGTEMTIDNIGNDGKFMTGNGIHGMVMSTNEFKKYANAKVTPEIDLQANSLLRISVTNGTPTSKIVLTKIK